MRLPWHTMIAWVLVAGMGMCAAAVLHADPRTSRSSGDHSKPDQVTPARLHEAVSGYQAGKLTKKASDDKAPQTLPRYRPHLAEPRDSEARHYERVFDHEASLAHRRMERGEWRMAIQSLERALEAASHLEGAVDIGPVEEMLRTARQRAADDGGGVQAPRGEITNSLGMKLVYIPSGEFAMGSARSDLRFIANEWSVPREMIEPEEPEHRVRISQPFYVGKYEVTVGEFRRFVEATGYQTVAERQGWGWVYDEQEQHWVRKQGASWKSPGIQTWEDHPVTLVCHEDAEAFCTWLSDVEQREYQLPTEAQWEYVARAKNGDTIFPWGDSYPDGTKLNMADRRSDLPWADRTVDDGGRRTAPVGSYEPNGFWVYDMVGNVWELCADRYDEKAYQDRDQTVTVDPGGPRRSRYHVVRGGNWAFGAGIARNAFRFGIPSDTCIDISGFRVAVPAYYTDPATAGTRQTDHLEENADQESTIPRIVDQVKDLAAAGRRAEARRLVDRFMAQTKDPRQWAHRGKDSLKRLLLSVIDVTEDERPGFFVNSLGMKMIRIPEGSFVMGSSESDIAWAMGSLAQAQPVSLENEFPFHKVRISRPFFLSSTEVTVGQFQSFVQETGYLTDAEDSGGGMVFDMEERTFEQESGSSWRNPGWEVEETEPVTMISYNDAQAFVDWLAVREKLPYKLPTEAQWEYAARGGIPMAHFPWGDNMPNGELANYADVNTDFPWRDEYADDGYEYVAPVGSYKPNAFGLYDIAGNVLEWVRDYYGEDYYRFTPEIDPQGPGHGEYRVTKGGEWTFGPVNLRCAFRGWSRPEIAFYNTGFRVAIDLSETLRPFHFANDFLTREWVPGQDQREVAQAVARESARRPRSPRDPEAGTGRPSAGGITHPSIKGVRVLDLGRRSDGQRAGLEQGDVIIEYDGVRNLTSEKFLALTAKTRRERRNPIVVFVRDGYQHTTRAARGYLGITVMNTRIRGPFKNPESRPTRRDQDQRKKHRKPLEWT